MRKFASFVTILFTLLIAGVNNVWGAWSGSGQAVSGSGTTWYVYDDSSEKYKTAGGAIAVYFDELTLSGPGSTVTFQAKKVTLGTGDLKLRKYNGSWSDIWNEGLSTSYADKSATIDVSTTKIQFYISSGGLKKYYRNLKVLMAQYIDAPSATSLNCGTKELGQSSTNNSVTIAWCNVPAMSYSITDDADGVFSVSVSNNSEAGKWNTATFTVTCDHTKNAGDHTAKLNITDTYGNYSKTINLSATTTKHPNTITWNQSTADKKNWGQEVTMTATATNTDYTNYPIVYTSSNNNYASVSGNVVTFYEAGAGKTVTIYANQATTATYLAPTQVSKTFTIKQTQTIVWDANKVDTNIRINKTRDINGYAYGEPASNRTITYSSADESKMTVSGTVLSAVSLGDVDIIATLAGDADYNEVTSTKTFTVKERETVEYYFDGALINENDVLNLLVGQTSGVVTSKNTDEVITSTTTRSDVASYNTTTHRIQANGEGTATIHLVQEPTDDYQNGNRTVVVNVALNTTTITTNVSAKTMEVGDTYNPALTTTNNEVAMDVHSSNSEVAVYEDGVIKAKSAGTTTITFAQAKTTKWSGDSKTIAVTVNKKNAVLSISGVPSTAWNQTIEPVITSTNTDENCAIAFEKISGADAAARQFGGTIHVYDKNNEVVTFRATQAGNTTYNATTKDFSFTVQKASKHVAFTMDQALYNALKGASSGDQAWDGGIKIGEAGSLFNWDDKYIVIGPFEGIPYQLSCNYSCSDAATGNDWRIYESTDGSNWGEILSESKAGTLSNRTLNPSTKYLKFFWSGNCAGYFKNITITERKEILVEGLTDNYIDFGNRYEVGNPATDKSIAIKWYNVPTTKVTSSNPGVFDVVTGTVNSEIDGFNESSSITIRYHHKAVTVGAQDEATITLTSENGYSKSFKVKGKTNKKDQTLIWADELTPISVGDIIPNPAIAPLALNYNIVETSEEGVAVIEDGVLKAKKVGTIKLRVANNGDAMWNAVSGDTTIKVTNLKVQRINWSQTFTRLKTGDADITLNASAYERVNGAAVSVARPVSYESDNTSVVTIVNGKLHVVGKGTANLKAKVAGVNGEYEPAEITRKVKVRKPSCGCEPYVLNVDGEKTLHTIDAEEFSLSGEPRTLSFDAKCQVAAIWGLWVYEYYDGNWQQIEYIDRDHIVSDNYNSFNYSLNRKSTGVKLSANTGSTLKRWIKNIKVTKAKYLELEDTKDKTTANVAFEDSHLGQTYIQSVVVNYSNIYDMLYVDHTNPNFRITPTEMADSCGQDGRATVTIVYYAKDAITEKDTITITDNNGLTAKIYVTASVAKSDQTITWNPAQTIKTTDNVTFDATASSALAVTYALAAGDEEVAELTEAGVLTIKKAGDIHVTASQAGSNLYNPVALEPVTIHISKVTPSVSVSPTASQVTLPNELSASVLNVTEAVMVDDKSNAVAGEYVWSAPTTALVPGEQNCEVIFTPNNTDWYNPTTFNVVVTANKRDQVITWNVADGQNWPCSEIIPLNAVLTDGVNNEVLNETLSYTSDNTACAEIMEGKLNIKTPGTVTITVSREGSAIYNAASITRTFNFVKTTPVITTLPTAHSIYQEQWLHESALVDGVVTASGHEVSGHFEWTTEDFMAIHIGTRNYNAEFVPANEACYYRVACEVPMTILQFERVFTDSLGNGKWDDQANWSNGFVPPAEVSVTIAKDVTIAMDNTVQVGKMTINEGQTVTVTSASEVSVGTIDLSANTALVVAGNSQLTVGNSIENPNNEYGDVLVKESATLTVDNSLKVNNVVLSASLNGGDQDATSSQIKGVEKMEINGDVFIDITFDPSGKISYGWYDFVVPFEVNMHGGIARINSADDKVLVYNVDFVLIEADEVARANGGKAWQRKNTGVLVPGKLYSISFDDEVVQNTFRFTWNRNGSINNGNSYDAQYADAVDDGLKGWNGMGNGMLQHGRIPAGLKVQAYNHANNVYELVDGDRTFAVGTAFFVQATQAGAIDWTAMSADENHPLFAPKRAPKATEEFKLTLRQEDLRKAADIFYFSASEEATETYMIGHDLVKMGTPTEAAVAQMWTTKGGKTLCDVETKWVNEIATTPLLFYTPKAQEYTLTAEKAPADMTLYLTYNDNIIWDLSDSPYVMELGEGTTSGYGLRIEAKKAPDITTGVDNANTDGKTVRKVMLGNQMYIITPSGAIYNVTGKFVR